MANKFHEAFEPIHATEEMKHKASAFILQEFAKRRRKRHMPLRYAVACCAILLLMGCGIGGYSFYATPVSYISVDVNPSVELGLNRLDRVVIAKAYNDDGALVLKNLSLKNKTYSEAVELLLADETFASYLTGDALLSFTVVSDKEEALLAGIQQCQGFPQSGAECHGANAQLMDEAHRSGLSMGKYQAFLELSRYAPSFTAEDCMGLTMRQIRELISQYASHGDVANPPNNSGQGSGHRGNGHGNGYRGGRN